ncbi:MAG: DNA-binding protein WhiA [Ruminococcaceae bacterium]|nr:DNA-binding protein WhiA [Oscillospiraceae bacterium]
MTESFSKKVKNQLEAVEIKKKCCKFTSVALSDLDKKADSAQLLGEIYRKCRCDVCREVFWRTLFTVYGSVTDPEKSYHMEFSFYHEDVRDSVMEMLLDTGFEFRPSVRKNKYIMYVKDSAVIEDFLVYMGAHGAAFDVMNSKIVHEFRNSVNRQVNCDTANIEKQLQAVKKYTDAISALIDSGKIDSLPADLKETAMLRIENDQLSLTDLGKLMNPPVSKSGVRHRLERILELAKKTGISFENTEN